MAWMTRTVAMVMTFLLLGIRKGTQLRFLLDTRKTSWALRASQGETIYHWAQLLHLSLMEWHWVSWGRLLGGLLRWQLCSSYSKKQYHEYWRCRELPPGEVSQKCAYTLTFQWLNNIFTGRPGIVGHYTETKMAPPRSVLHLVIRSLNVAVVGW
jgi:hypothetical protein